MARERYLVGVSEEELQYTDRSTQLTPKGKLENIWYHHKWGILGGVFAVIVAAVLIVQLITRVTPDYSICIAASTYIPEPIVEELEKALLPYAEDVNGDGEVAVQIQALNVQKEDEYTQVGVNNRQAVIAHIAAGDVMIFAFSPSFYNSFIAGMTAEEDFSFFTALGAEGETVAEDGTYFTFDLSAFAQSVWSDYPKEQIDEMLPEPLVIGVRYVDASAKDEHKQAQQRHLELLRRFLKDEKVAQS
ncbi:MAG: hypothetical protein IJO59_04335 [Clostridia bacterium]|nr:hypothetical protein [Clostridia bacterium]